MKKILKQLETRVWRTYRGGKLLEEFLGKSDPKDSDKPEDWISSFVEAKNKNYIKNEGITRVLTEDGERLIREAVSKNDFGPQKTQSGVLIKYLDSSERLGIQVHPTKEFSKEYFGTPYGKTECWHILNTREIDGEPAAVYIGFREFVTKELWRELFQKQDIEGMLRCLHKFPVKKGDTVLVRGGMPHAIGAGCFLLEIQEPTDYTLRVERVTVGGDTLSDRQMHYGIGFQNMLQCFDYTPRTREEARNYCFLKPRAQKLTGGSVMTLADYEDTPCFQLKKVNAESATLKFDSFVTLISLSDGGLLKYSGEEIPLFRADKLFVPAEIGEIHLENAACLICYPPKLSND